MQKNPKVPMGSKSLGTSMIEDERVNESVMIQLSVLIVLQQN